MRISAVGVSFPSPSLETRDPPLHTSALRLDGVGHAPAANDRGGLRARYPDFEIERHGIACPVVLTVIFLFTPFRSSFFRSGIQAKPGTSSLAPGTLITTSLWPASGESIDEPFESQRKPAATQSL
jgi:hypothetical protein